MLSVKSFKHDRYFCNNSKHNLSKCFIIKIYSNEKTSYNNIAINNLKQMIKNCIIFKYIITNDYFNYRAYEYLGIANITNSSQYYYAFYDLTIFNVLKYYYDNSQLHFQQKKLDFNYPISNNLKINQYSKYTQLWIINNYKKLPNNQPIILK